MRRHRVQVPIKLLLADPPWRFSDALPGKKRGAAKHYPVLSVAEIARHPLPPIADDALLLLWKVPAMPEEALFVARAWGFVPKSEIVWVKETKTGKLHFGMGRYVRNCHEACIVAARGRARDLILDLSVRSVFSAPVGEHSEKPVEIYEIAERLSPGPYAEVFARRGRPGWRSYGLDLVGEPASA